MIISRRFNMHKVVRVYKRFIYLNILLITFIFALIRLFDSDTNPLFGDPLWNQSLDFDRLQVSNETGHPSGYYLVPNYIHFIHFGGIPLLYHQMICVLAAFKNQKPDKIFFHFDKITTFTGKYWQVLTQTPGFKEVMVHYKLRLPTYIYGQKISETWRNWHGSDIARIRVVMTYGGIYLDNDCYLVRSVDLYRKFEMTVSWDEDDDLGNQIIIAHKDARFLRKWLECYKQYDPTKWYYNAGEKPTSTVLYQHPELVHRVTALFGTHMKYVEKIFRQYWPEWKYFYNIHLYIRATRKKKRIKIGISVVGEDLNETNIGYYNITFRYMAYDVYDIANVKWPKAEF